LGNHHCADEAPKEATKDLFPGEDDTGALSNLTVSGSCTDLDKTDLRKGLLSSVSTGPFFY
jgi:hypothetical protein